MVCQIKILLCIQLLVSTALALPSNPESKHEKRSIPGSAPENLVEKRPGKSSTAKSDLGSTKIPSKETAISENKTEPPPNILHQRLPDFESDQLKIKVLDLTKSFKEEGSAQVGFPISGPQTHIIKVPEPYIIRVPHYIILREPELVVNGDHFGGATFPGSFHPFGEFPGITQGFPSGENIFDISQIYPSNPIEISQGFEGFPPISGVSEIQGLPGFGDINQEFLQPEQIATVGLDDHQNIHHETDSVIVDSVETLIKSDRNEKVLKEKTPSKEGTFVK